MLLLIFQQNQQIDTGAVVEPPASEQRAHGGPVEDRPRIPAYYLYDSSLEAKQAPPAPPITAPKPTPAPVSAPVALVKPAPALTQALVQRFIDQQLRQAQEAVSTAPPLTIALDLSVLAVVPAQDVAAEQAAQARRRRDDHELALLMLLT